MALLEVENLEVYYGLIRAVKGVSFYAERGEIVALIGANGAGKTTILHAINGLQPARGGTVKYGGRDLLKTPAHKIVRLGLTQVPEGRRVFSELSVKDNLLLGAYSDTCSNCFRGLRNAFRRRQARFRAANSKCLPWAER